MAAPVLSSAVRTSLLSLGNPHLILGATQQRLATGKQIVSALDGPAAFFTAASLSARAGGLANLLDRMDLAQRTIEAANAGSEAIEQLLHLAKGRLSETLRTPETVTVPGNAEVTGTVPFGADTPATLSGANALPADSAAIATGTQTIVPDSAAVLTGLNGVAADTAASATGTKPIPADTAAEATGTQTIAADVAAEVNGAGAALAPDAVARTSSNGISWGLNGVLLTLGGLLGQSITVNGETFYFGLSTNGQELQQFIDNIDGLSAEVTSNHLVITGDNAESVIDISFSSPLVGTLTGLPEGVREPVNLLTQGAAAQGETLDIQIGGNPPLDIVFGSDDGAGEISTLAELDARLGALAGGTASADTANGNISVQSSAAADDIVIGGSATLGNFGIAADTHEANNATLGALNGTLTVSYGGFDDSIAFGPDDGAGEVNTRAELQARLGDLSLNGDTGIAFTVDGGGRLMLAAPDATGDIMIDGGGAVLAALGFSAGQSERPANGTLGGLAGNLSFSFGGDTDTIIFGADDSAGEADTRAELEARLADLTLNGDTGIAFSLDGGNRIAVTAPDGSSDILIDGDAAVLAATGFTAGQTAEPDNATLRSLTGSLTFSFNGFDDSITFGSDDGVGEVDTRAGLEARLSALTLGANTGASFGLDGSGRLVVAAPDDNGNLSVTGGAAALAALGFSAGQTASPANGMLAGLAGNLSFSFGGDTDTIIFGADDSAGEADTRAELEAALADLTLNGDTGAAFALDESNRILVTSPDAGSDITVNGGAGVLAAVGFSHGQIAEAGNAALDGLTGSLTLSFGGQSDTIRFGSDDAAGDVSNLAELSARLANLSLDGDTGLVFSLDGSGRLAVAAPDASDDITMTGNASVLTAIGFSSGQTGERGNASLAALVAGNETLAISAGDASDTLSFGADTGAGEISSLAELEAAIADPLPNTGVMLSLLDGNLLQVTGPSGADLTIGGSNGAAAAAAFGLPVTVAAPQAVTVPSALRNTARDSYNLLLEQIDSVASDAIYNGVNLLLGDSLRVVLNESATGILNIDGVSSDSGGLGLEKLDGDTFLTGAGVQTMLADINSAIGRLRRDREQFGFASASADIRKTFTRNLVSTLEAGASGLTIADMNKESARLLALDLRTRLGMSALSLSAGNDGNIMRLFS